MPFAIKTPEGFVKMNTENPDYCNLIHSYKVGHTEKPESVWGSKYRAAVDAQLLSLKTFSIDEVS